MMATYVPACFRNNRVKNGPEKHVVDILIEKRAKKLGSSRFWPLYKKILYPVLEYAGAVDMVNAITDLPGREVMEYMSRFLHLDIIADGLDNIPRTGRILIASTHPTGVPDGIAMFDTLKNLRPDMMFFASRVIPDMAPGLSGIVIPVEWDRTRYTIARSRRMLARVSAEFGRERCIILFPSGRPAKAGRSRRPEECRWRASAAVLARKYDCNIIPAKIVARNSRLYHLFSGISGELRDMMLFHEILNKKGSPFKVSFGKAVTPDKFEGPPVLAAGKLRHHAVSVRTDDRL